jgi:hypothetical protein
MPTASKTAIAASAVISLLILLVWAALISTLSDLGHSDAAGNGLAEAYAAIEIIVVWILLGVLLLVTGIAGEISWLTASAAAALLLASAFAAIKALGLLEDTSTPPFLWPIITPALVPPLVVALGFWTLLPALRAAIPAGWAVGFGLGVTLLLCVAQWPMLQARQSVEKHHAALSAKWATDFAHLSPDAPLWEWTPFLNTRNDIRQAQVLSGIRKLDRRQADAETMLARGDFPLRYLGQMDLDLTQSICDEARALLRQRVRPLMSPSPGSRPYTDVAEQVADALAAMQWLVGYGCSCDAESQAWEAMANTYRNPNYDVVELRDLRDPAALNRLRLQSPDRFAMLTSQSPLQAWLKFAADDATYQQAIEGARKLDHRTADAIEMLNHDEYQASMVLAYMPVLDLEPTNELCSASLKVLHERFAQVYRPPANDPRTYNELLERLGTVTPLNALRWLASHGCDTGATVTEAETLIRAYQDSPARSAMLQSLAHLAR